jgi:hypothetical protein
VSDSSAERRAALTVLGLSDDATAADITQAYRRLAKVTHPDTAGPTDRDAARRFSALTDAYRSLTAPPHGSEAHPVGPPRPTGRPVSVRVRSAGTRKTEQPPIVARPVRITPAPPRRDRAE